MSWVEEFLVAEPERAASPIIPIAQRMAEAIRLEIDRLLLEAIVNDANTKVADEAVTVTKDGWRLGPGWGVGR